MHNEIKIGDCFFNLKLFSCLRVKYLRDEYATVITWRPNGCKVGNTVNIKLENLTKLPYVPLEAVRVYAGGKSFEFELTDAPECEDY